MSSCKQLANLLLHRLIVALAPNMKHDVSVLIDQIAIRPDIRVVFTPDRAVHICDNRPWQGEALGRVANVVRLESHLKLAEMHTNDVKAIGVILGVPAL